MPTLAQRLAGGPSEPWPARPIPVALVITELDVGGAERAMVALARGLDRGRWSPTALALGPDAPMAEPLRAAGVPVRCLGVDPRRPIRAVANLAQALREVRPALVQSFLFHANVAARLAARRAGRPPVLGGLRVAERGKAWHRALDRLTFGLGVGSVCVSEGVRRFSVEVGRLPASSLVVIPNSVDPGPIDRARPVDRADLSLPRDGHLALFVGRLEIQKGLDDLLDAAAVVAAARPDWHLVIVGDGPEGERLRRRAESLGTLADRLRWLGRRDDVPSLLRSADVLVLPSLWEGMPNVVLEAMAARLPVVATAVEGTTDLVVPGATGWLVPPSDPPALASALVEAASNLDRRRWYGEAGRARVEAIYFPERVVADYETLWARVLGLAPPDPLALSRLDPATPPLQ